MNSKWSFELYLKLFSSKDIVLRLFCNRSDKSEFVAYSIGFNNFAGPPFTCAPIMAESFPDAPVKSTAYFFHRGCVIISVGETYIDIGSLEPCKRSFHAFNYMLSGKPNRADLELRVPPEKLGAYHEILSWEVIFFESLTELPFCLTKTIDFGSVEKINSQIPSPFDALHASFGCFGSVGIHPISIADNRHF
jgi:hypothetical protein